MNGCKIQGCLFTYVLGAGQELNSATPSSAWGFCFQRSFHQKDHLIKSPCTCILSRRVEDQSNPGSLRKTCSMITPTVFNGFPCFYKCVHRIGHVYFISQQTVFPEHDLPLFGSVVGTEEIHKTVQQIQNHRRFQQNVGKENFFKL